ncbi:UDP:flavonoid glycosyltransferase YjiC (YdhE family) [Micromonospora sp. Llam0]|uniref:glycosyltransferase n=1 Tax=Micromonospora sp. Llam0 TaxID=2485143 RepID=UPI000F48A827|nr:glycosyltransferase [Micromonospora sp. Llam0]ROO63298.1 UDP:flavonoid glycosyltransferase YjiC (YdhE family) [Micromonospora sp. Llam0]
MRRRRVLVFSIPNEGHLNILKRLIRRHRAEDSFRLVLVDRQTTAPRLGDLAGSTVAVPGCREFRNTPADRVFDRAYRLFGECLAVARAYRPDLVLYDFCAIEGALVARRLGVPAWCSVPGLVGPMTDAGYLRRCLTAPANTAALDALDRRYGVTLDPATVELVSNCLHLPAEQNILWSYRTVTPTDFRDNRAAVGYRFAGYLSDGWPSRDRPDHQDGHGAGRESRGAGPARPVVYLSFGTEVLDNLWYAEPELVGALRRCVAGLARHWSSADLTVVFPTRGRRILDRYPANWVIRHAVDQQRVLSRADVFVTHGGSNSFHEAIIARVPMVVVPFFGDQPLVARQAARLGIGISLDAGARTGRDAAYRLLDVGCADRIAAAVRRIRDDRRYRESLAGLDLTAVAALAPTDDDRPVTRRVGPVVATPPRSGTASTPR